MTPSRLSDIKYSSIKKIVNQFRLEWLLMCVTLVSLVYLSLLSLLGESLPPQLSELSETPHQPENQRTGARVCAAPVRGVEITKPAAYTDHSLVGWLLLHVSFVFQFEAFLSAKFY